ncbi:MAG: hypothetical protein NT133_04815 [Alphaproteobacteria bacterium]|nr:hypothetical protein [Alphaproteobacteria bacterium]
MKPPSPADLLRGIRRQMARMPSLSMARIPDAPSQPVRDPWPGDPGRGAALLRGDIEAGGVKGQLKPGGFTVPAGANPNPPLLRGLPPKRTARIPPHRSATGSPNRRSTRSPSGPTSPAHASPPGSAITTSSPPPPMTGFANG